MTMVERRLGVCVESPVSVLFVTHHLPWPTTSGGRQREAQLLQILAGRHNIEIVAVTKALESDRSGVAYARELGLTVRLFAACRSRHVLKSSLVRRHGSSDARRYLSHRLADDRTVVHVEGHYLLPVVARSAWSRTLLIEHNVESMLLRQQAALSTRSSLRVCLDTGRTASLERRAWRNVAVVGALSVDDAAVIRSAAPATDVCVLPSGADHLLAARSGGSGGGAPSVDAIFVANFGYAPNREAVRTLVTEIFPRVTADLPHARLAIAGGAPPAWLIDASRHERRLLVPGWIDDLSAWLHAAKVVVCPLRIGGGIKIKMLEAVAAARCIVTTSVGVQGLSERVKNALVIRDDPESFAQAVIALLRSDRLRNGYQIAMAAAAKTLPTWQASAADLEACWLRLAGR